MNEIAPWVFYLRGCAACLGLLIFVRAVPLRSRLIGADRKYGRVSQRLLWWGLQLVWCVLLFSAIMYEKAVEKLRFYQDMPVVIAIFTLYVFWSRRIHLKNALYVGVIVFLCNDFCTACINALYRHEPVFGSLATNILVELLYFILMAYLTWFLSRFIPENSDIVIPWMNFFLLLLVLLPYLVLRSSDLLYMSEDPAVEAFLFLTIIATFAVFMGNYTTIVAQLEHARRLELEIELQERTKRFEIKKETIAEVNRRYHDLVKYTSLIERSGEVPSLDRYSSVHGEDSVAPQAFCETGNSLLDLLLWEALDTCQAKNIRLISTIDANDCGFISDFDLRTIVGNALDNAIEAVERVTDPEKREIRLRFCRLNNLIIYRIENSYVGNLTRDGSTFMTHKEDPDSHGFGIDTIRRTAERYNGSLVIETPEDRFILTVMLPIPE